MAAMKPGDVIIFEAGDSWLSKAIAKLTDSNVSHAAMRYTGGRMVEMKSGGIRVNGCYETLRGEKAYLLRLSPEKDPTPLIAAADQYIREKTIYDFPDLVFFAGLLIYRGIRPTRPWQNVADMVINAACAVLDRALNRIIHYGSKAPYMVCSQLVYQCYLDCGPEYEIRLQDALLQSAVLERISIADLAHDRPQSERLFHQDPAFKIHMEIESMAHALCDAADSTDPADPIKTKRLGETDLHGTVSYAKRFMELLERIVEQSEIDLPLPALFVAPSDLLSHAVNLKQYDTAVLSRRKG